MDVTTVQPDIPITETTAEVIDTAIAVAEAPASRTNPYSHPKEISLRGGPILDFVPVADNSKSARKNFQATMRAIDGSTFSLNLFGFNNFTRCFGINGAQGMRADVDDLNETILSIARSHSWDTAYALGEGKVAFTRDLSGTQIMAGLVDSYAKRKYSDTKSTALTLNRSGFLPHPNDQHYVDAVVTGTINFNAVKFNTWTEIVRQICTNGMTQALASSNKNENYHSDWITQAIEKTNQSQAGLIRMVEIMCNVRVMDEQKTLEALSVSGLPAWVGEKAQKLIDNSKKDAMELKERDKLCPFGLRTLWDFLNVFTYAMHHVSNIATKQTLQERLFKYSFREPFLRELQEVGAVA